MSQLPLEMAQLVTRDLQMEILSHIDASDQIQRVLQEHGKQMLKIGLFGHKRGVVQQDEERGSHPKM